MRIAQDTTDGSPCRNGYVASNDPVIVEPQGDCVMMDYNQALSQYKDIINCEVAYSEDMNCLLPSSTQPGMGPGPHLS